MDLDAYHFPEDLKTISGAEIPALCACLRERITQVVSKNGGHLAGNLGVVEMTVALHRVFDFPKDKLIFDVGHQCYTHKILSGRNDRFDTLRTFGGISGFPKREESVFDVYETGHASTALSAALGMARARDLMGENHHVIAVVGDGAFTGGMCYEALNDADKTRLIVILNDNQMSIAPNVGALSRYLSFMRTSKGWIGAKKAVVAFLSKLPVVGNPLYRWAEQFKNHVRNVFVKDTFFQSMGFRYVGPIDGQDEQWLEKMLDRAKGMDGPVLLHVVTTKGAGYRPAELSPDRMHGTPPFDMENGQPVKKSTARSFGKNAGEILVSMAGNDPKIVAVSAAMTDAVGLSGFAKAYPDRLFDVGIAEEHAVVLAAGMASSGLRPYVFIYDTFMQRAYDQVLHDVCLQNLPVCFMIDRMGLGGEDGPTHHGVFGASWMRALPSLCVLSPRSIEELEQMMLWTRTHDGPVAIRYPRAEAEGQQPCSGFQIGRWEEIQPGDGPALIAHGSGMLKETLDAAGLLRAKGLSCRVIYASSVKPLDIALLKEVAQGRYYIIEEQQRSGSLGSYVLEKANELGFAPPALCIGIPDRFVPHGKRAQLLETVGLDAKSIAGIVEGQKL